MVLTNSAHYPADSFSHLSIWVLEHSQEVLECLNNDKREFRFIWSFRDGSKSHERCVLLFPVLRLDVHSHISNNWVHELIAKKDREPLEAACRG